MRIDEVVAHNSDRVDEIFGIGKWMQQRSAFKGGRANLKATADNLMLELARFLGSRDIKRYDEADYDDIIDFFKSKKVSDDFLSHIKKISGFYDKNTIKSIIKYAAHWAIHGNPPRKGFYLGIENPNQTSRLSQPSSANQGGSKGTLSAPSAPSTSTSTTASKPSRLSQPSSSAKKTSTSTTASKPSRLSQPSSSAKKTSTSTTASKPKTPRAATGGKPRVRTKKP